MRKKIWKSNVCNTSYELSKLATKTEQFGPEINDLTTAWDYSHICCMYLWDLRVVHAVPAVVGVPHVAVVVSRVTGEAIVNQHSVQSVPLTGTLEGVTTTRWILIMHAQHTVQCLVGATISRNCSLRIHSQYTRAYTAHRYCHKLQQGVIQDFGVEGGNEKSNQKMLLKKVNCYFNTQQ